MGWFGNSDEVLRLKRQVHELEAEKGRAESATDVIGANYADAVRRHRQVLAEKDEADAMRDAAVERANELQKRNDELHDQRNEMDLLKVQWRTKALKLDQELAALKESRDKPLIQAIRRAVGSRVYTHGGKPEDWIRDAIASAREAGRGELEGKMNKLQAEVTKSWVDAGKFRRLKELLGLGEKDH